jgi:(2Fe-2S) ferredoxin
MSPLAPKPDVKVKKLDRHLFVCTNERPAGHPRGCCRSKGAEELLQAFKAEAARAGLGSQVRAQKAGCLDVCEYGASAVVYPDNVWYGAVTPADVAEIVKSHLVEGQPVERLRIPGK